MTSDQIWRNNINFPSKVLFFVLLVCGKHPLYSQWSTDPWQNTPVNIQEFGQIAPQLCPDNNGGTYVTYLERGRKLYVQHVDRFGVNKWGEYGALICTNSVTSISVAPDLVNSIVDEDGSVFVLWEDHRDRPPDTPSYCYATALYIQKIDSSGNVLWQNNGLELSPYNLPQNCFTCSNITGSEEIVSDGEGGVYIGWSKQPNDSLCQVGKVVAYVQHVDSNGNILWDEWGKSRGVYYGGTNIAPDEDGGIFSIAYSEIDIVRLNPAGDLVWEDTVFISGGHPKFFPDGQGGIIGVTHMPLVDFWYDTLLFHRINADGDILWTDNKFGLSGFINSMHNWEAFPDGNGGVIATWVLNSTGNFAAYTQRVDSSGNIIFDSLGVASYIDAIDDEGNWFDYWYRGTSTGFRSYARKFDKNGEQQWPGSYGVLYKIRSEWWQAYSPRSFVPDYNGGVIIAWDETHHMTTNWDIMAQMVNSEGELGEVLLAVDHTDKNMLLPDFELFPNYPNPFNNYTAIRFNVKNPGEYKLNIYSINGHEIRNETYRNLEPGYYDYIFNASSQNGSRLSSGIYFCKLANNGVQKTIKLLLLK